MERINVVKTTKEVKSLSTLWGEIGNVFRDNSSESSLDLYKLKELTKNFKNTADSLMDDWDVSSSTNESLTNLSTCGEELLDLIENIIGDCELNDGKNYNKYVKKAHVYHAQTTYAVICYLENLDDEFTVVVEEDK